MRMYRVKELADLAGVSARTLRHYDSIGLLKPACISAAGYRLYGEREVDLLQQILFYRERGMDLKEIREILYTENFDILGALEEHLRELEARKAHTESLIDLVRRSITAMKGEEVMTDAEKFQAFKEQVTDQYEQMYGAEAREKYGDSQVDAAMQKVLNMTPEAYERFENLGKEIRQRLAEAVTAGVSPESPEAERIVMLHKEWLGMTWKTYTREAHRAMADLYAMDERFTAYYDREVPGCAGFLEQAIRRRIS
ncbi:MAG TPA: MerR family transcriptional regulator [Candidatus Pullilachnospira intestinigallinarum]|nr:MerR family transcriptional regulator [Candidatus Pullilachnospira intestinigallinarum]